MGDFSVRSMVLQGYFQTCEELEFDPIPLLKKHAIEPATLNEFNAKIPLESVTALLEETAIVSKRQDFGLLMGSHWGFDKIGPLSMVVLACKTFEDLINKLMNYANAVNLGFQYRLSRQSNYVTAEFNVNTAKQFQSIQTIELFLSRYITLSKHCIGQNWAPKAFLFQHKQNTDKDAYRAILSRVPTFEAELNGMVFDEIDLSLRTDINEDFMHQKIDEYMSGLITQPNISLTEKLKLAITDSYGRGEMPELQKLCRQFSVSSRTLQHKLNVEGTSFRQILSDVQANIALTLLSQQHLEVSAVSDLLGFSEVSAFSRAFKKWHGQPPSSYLQLRA